MMQCNKTRRTRFPVLALIAVGLAAWGPAGADAASFIDLHSIEMGPPSTALSDPDSQSMNARDRGGERATNGLRTAEVRKYEIPQAERATPQRAAPQPQAVVPRAAPAPKARSAPSQRSRRGGRARGAPAYGGSCAACRNACYNRLHGTPGFVPCMRSCWNRLCRR